jgi:hypothetical protein
MADVDPLADFIRTHISDDARTAEEAIGPLGGRWRADGGGGVEVVTEARTADVYQRTVCFSGEGAPTIEEALHIARNDPQRTIADAEARHRIVDLCESTIQRAEDAYFHGDAETERERAGAAAQFARSVLRLLALRYADLGDYDPRWRPAQPGDWPPLSL